MTHVDKNKRFSFLLEKYRNDSLTKAEYEEFLKRLNAPDAQDELDEMLTGYWNLSGDGPLAVDEQEPSPNKPTFFSGRRNLMKWSIAASLLVMLTATLLYVVRPSGEYVTYKTDFGEIKEVNLPDGSVVTLNANSEFSWNCDWEDEEARQVTLKGEAFFDIKHVRGMTFTVQTGDVSVEVVGTSFNVDSRNQKTAVYLDEGKVKLHVDRERSDAIVMKPGEKVDYNAANGKLVKTADESMSSAASWKDGVLNFKDLEFRDVLEKLTAIYGKKFTCADDDILSRHMYLGVPYKDWNQVKEALELSMDIKISEHEDTYVIRKE